VNVESAMPSPKLEPRDPARLRDRHWRRQLWLTGLLLMLWSVISFGVAACARALSFTIFGAPFSVWIAAQGALVIFVFIVWLHSRVSVREDLEVEDSMDARP
jgi:putative solute:sodium symporter small subunit